MDEIYTDYTTRSLVASAQYKGFRYYIITLGAYPCAYVSIPSGHDLRGVDYTYINGIGVHGGLTYSEFFLQLKNIILKGWFIGWDYGHYGDYMKLYHDMEFSFGGKKWTKEEIEEDCKSVIDQILKGDYEIWTD